MEINHSDIEEALSSYDEFIDYDFDDHFDRENAITPFDTIDFLKSIPDEDKFTCGEAILPNLSYEEYNMRFEEFMNARRNT